MKEYRHYECEYNHGWVFLRDSEAEEQVAETFCPWGHEAVVTRKRALTRFLEVSLRPAEEMDGLGKVSSGNRIYLVLTDLKTGQERMSNRTFTPNEIEQVQRQFYFISVEQGWRLLDRMEHTL